MRIFDRVAQDDFVEMKRKGEDIFYGIQLYGNNDSLLIYKGKNSLGNYAELEFKDVYIDKEQYANGDYYNEVTFMVYVGDLIRQLKAFYGYTEE